MNGAAQTPAADAGRRRQRQVVAGLGISFLGFALATVLLPSAPGALSGALPIAAAALLATWMGGIVMGNAMGPLRRRRRGA